MALLLFGFQPDKPIVIASTPIDTGVIPPKPKDTLIINDPVDTIIIPPPLPVVELKPFEINTDIENETIQDLKDVLKDYKDGREINIIKVSLDQRTGQAFYISANKKSVELKYTTKQSLENAVYSYLGMLGIHWYGAGENWFVKQPILNEVNIAGKWIEPTFRNRTFDGTGGLDYGLSIDPNFEYKKNWYAFKRRNRFNGDFVQPSHAGQAFYISNVALCNAHPEWFNSQLGKESGRIRVEIPEAVQAYKDWYKRYPNVTDSFVTINVDPEDGRGAADDPLPPNGFNGIENWNASDKWWYFANEIAKEYDSNSTKIHIAALAYGDGSTNTLVPKFPLKKNVFPVIIPYAFQTAYLPKQMVKTWNANTAGNMGIYDYWNITQWSLGLPQFNIYNIPKLLSFWRTNSIDCIQQETTDAGGPTGHMFWLAGQLEFDTTKNFDALYHKYLVDCFGDGWKPLKNMFDRWSLNYQYNQDVNFSLKDLKDATDAVEVNSPQWKRINDLKAYVHFMKLMAQRNGTQANNDAVYQYIYSIHQRMLVQTVALTGQRYLGNAPEPLTAHQLTEAEIEKTFAADLAALPVEYEISNMVFDYDKATFVDSIPINSWKYGIFSGARFKAQFTGKVSINIGAVGKTQAKIYTDDSIYINEPISKENSTFKEVVDGETWNTKNYQIDVTKGQIITLSTTYGWGRIKPITPGIILFSTPAPNDFDNAQYPTKYFYVPKGTTKIAYNDGEPQPTNGRGYLVTPDGISLVRKATTAAGIYTVDVPKGQDGKVWKASFGHSSWSFANIPNISTLQFFKYTE